ncbi:MAG: hypothetical protein KAT43_06780 [Nanoarchaeota archaeon]|nr:hypothetical protein [Nanoarchaeota archaeon]
MFEGNNIIEKLVRFRYLGYMMVGGFILLFLFIANIGYVTNFESVTALTVSERVDTIAKALPSILGLVLLSIIAIFFIIFEMHLKLKLKGLTSPLHKLAHVEKSIVMQLSVDSDALEEERVKRERKERKFKIPLIKPGEKIAELVRHTVVAKEKQEEPEAEEPEIYKEHEAEKVKKEKVKGPSWIRTNMETLRKKHDHRLKQKKCGHKQRLLGLQAKKRELLCKKKELEQGKVHKARQVAVKNAEKAKKQREKEKLLQKRLLEKEKLKQNRLLEREGLKKQKEKERLQQKRLLEKQEIRKEKEAAKQKRMSEKKRLQRRKEALKQERLLEKKKRKQTKLRAKRARLAAKEKLQAKKEMEQRKEQLKLDRQRKLEQKKQEHAKRLETQKKKRELAYLNKKQILEKRKLVARQRRQKGKQEGDSYYRDLQSEFKNLDRGLDSLMKRSGR